MLNFTIVVNDNGELKSITAAEIDKYPKIAKKLDKAMNEILDKQSIEKYGDDWPPKNATWFSGPAW